MRRGRTHCPIGHGTLGLRPGTGRRAFALLLAVTLAACATGRLKVGPAKEGEVVEAEGWTPWDAKDLIGTKRRSLAEAQKKAVERVVGVYISAKTRVAQAVHVNQNILANVGGYIQKYDILWERQDGEFYKTKIRALVLYRKVGEDLKSLGLVKPPPPPGNPKVVVLVGTKGAWSENRDGRASGSVRRSLLERGFSVIDRNDPISFSTRKSTDTTIAMRVGQDLGADLVVKGEAEAYPIQDIRLAGFISYRARIELAALKPATGEVIAHKIQEASALDPSPGIAEAKALENAGALAGEALAATLLESLKSQTHVALRILGLTGLDAVQQLAEDLRLTPDIQAVTLSEYRKEGTELRVTTEGIAGDDLAALVLRMKKYPLTVRSVLPYAVEFSFGSAP